MAPWHSTGMRNSFESAVCGRERVWPGGKNEEPLAWTREVELSGADLGAVPGAARLSQNVPLSVTQEGASL